MPSTPPADNPTAGPPVRLKLERDGFLDGRRCATLEIATTTTDMDHLLRETRKTATTPDRPQGLQRRGGRSRAPHRPAERQAGQPPHAGAGTRRRHHLQAGTRSRTRSNRTTTVWACLPGWQRDGATRVYRNRARPLQARDTATFLPTDKQPGGDGEAGDHPSTKT